MQSLLGDNLSISDKEYTMKQSNAPPESYENQAKQAEWNNQSKDTAISSDNHVHFNKETDTAQKSRPRAVSSSGPLLATREVPPPPIITNLQLLSILMGSLKLILHCHHTESSLPRYELIVYYYYFRCWKGQLMGVTSMGRSLLVHILDIVKTI